MIELQGSKEYQLSVSRLYQELADVSRLVKTLPDLKTVKEAAPERAVIVVAPGLSFIKGELETTIVRISALPEAEAALEVQSKGIGTTVKVLASFTLTSTESGTLLNWKATVAELGGLLKLVPGSLLKGAANKVIEGWLTSLPDKLAASA